MYLLIQEYKNAKIVFQEIMISLILNMFYMRMFFKKVDGIEKEKGMVLKIRTVLFITKLCKQNCIFM